jgi:hypothetical protein
MPSKKFVTRGPADPGTFKSDLARAQVMLLPEVDAFGSAKIKVRTRRTARGVLVRQFSLVPMRREDDGKRRTKTRAAKVAGSTQGAR